MVTKRLVLKDYIITSTGRYCLNCRKHSIVKVFNRKTGNEGLSCINCGEEEI